MKKEIVIFENSLLNDNSEKMLEKLSFNIALNNKDEDINELLIECLNILEKLSLLNQKNVNIIIKSFIKAKVNDKKNKLYTLINEADLLNNKILNQKNIIKNQISNDYYDFKKNIEKSNFKDKISCNINDVLLFEIESLDILKEVCQSAFITTLEKNEDIEIYANEISKNLIYNVICEYNFNKDLILKNSQIILNSAFEIANEYNKNSAKALCIGVIKGIQEGIALGIDKFKISFRYCTLEEDLKLKEKELIEIESEFIEFIKLQSKICEQPVKSILKDLLSKDLDNLFAKFKRFVIDGKEELIYAIENFKKKTKMIDISELTEQKLHLLSKEFKKIGEKYKDINNIEATKLGKNLFDKVKSLIKK